MTLTLCLVHVLVGVMYMFGLVPTSTSRCPLHALSRLKQHPHTSGVIPLMRYRSPLYALSNGIYCDAQHLSGLGHRSPVGSRLSGTILAVTSRLSSTVLYGVLFLHNL